MASSITQKHKIADGIYGEAADAEALHDLAALGASLEELRRIELSRRELAGDGRPETAHGKSAVALERRACLAKIESLLRKTNGRNPPSTAAQRTLASISKVVKKIRESNGSADGDLEELQSLAGLFSEREKMRSCLLH